MLLIQRGNDEILYTKKCRVRYVLVVEEHEKIFHFAFSYKKYVQRSRIQDHLTSLPDPRIKVFRLVTEYYQKEFSLFVY